MASRIEDYALIGNRMTGALVSRSGSIDWFSAPRFDSRACFTALLGTPQNGFWKLYPTDEVKRIERRYRPGTLVLETQFTTAGGKAVLIDCMALNAGRTDILRTVVGLEGRVSWRSDMRPRFEYGSATPSIERLDDGRYAATAGADRVLFAASSGTCEKNAALISSCNVAAGEQETFSLTWADSWHKPPSSPAVREATERASEQWGRWSGRYKTKGPYGEAVLRSLITLQALANPETGGIVAAPTTSLPEEIGGERNWDYRYCWLRDATFTLYALMQAGFDDEARSWRAWLLRAIGGAPDEMQILYGVNGERRITENEATWLSGYEGSKPVHLGNAASGQRQLDVYGEVLDVLYQAERNNLQAGAEAWDVEVALANHVAKIWNEPDDGIWEVRGGRRQFTQSKVMTWVALDRAIRSVEDFGNEGPVDHWRKVRDEIHSEVCDKGFNGKVGAFVQYFGGDTLDASLLLMPQVGFLPACDDRVQGTVAAIEKRLMSDGLVWRYDSQTSVDGLKGGEGSFLPCSFWLADVYVLQGRRDEARALFEHLLELRNDVGLLSEEYDLHGNRQVGNFPQAFSHVALINTALNLDSDRKPAVSRSSR